MTMMDPSRVGSWYYNYNEDDTLEHRFSVLNELRVDQKLCDAVLKVGGHLFHVHKAVLACCSPYFRALFTNGMQESGKNELEISDVDPGAMEKVIHYAYTFEVIATESNVEVLMATADKLNVTGILRVCQDVIQKSLSHVNCFHYLGFSRTFNFHILEQKIIKFIKVNFDRIGLMNDELLELDFEEIEQLLSCDELNVRSEELVFETVVRWISHAPDKRISHLPRLLNCVRLGLVPTEYFLEKISGHKYLKGNEDCKTMLKNTWDFLYELDRTANKDIDLQNPLVRPRIPHEVLFSIGGWSGGNPITFFESYDTRADRWYTHAFVEDNTPRAYHAVVSLDAKIYIIGGFDGTSYFNSMRCFNPASGVWSEAAPMHHQRCYVSAATMDDFIYACGGYDGRWRQQTCERYDPKANQWHMIAKMHLQRSDAGCAALNGVLYMAGGFNGEECLNSAEMYDPRVDEWTMIRPMGKPRSGVCVVAYGDCIYALGGFNGVRRQACGEKYDPIHKTWNPIRKMFTPRSNFAAVVMDRMIFAIGGFNGTTTVPHMECYDSEVGEWYDATDMNINRSALSACVVTGLPNVCDFTYHGHVTAKLMDDEELMSEKDL